MPIIIWVLNFIAHFTQDKNVIKLIIQFRININFTMLLTFGTLKKRYVLFIMFTLPTCGSYINNVYNNTLDQPVINIRNRVFCNKCHICLIRRNKLHIFSLISAFSVRFFANPLYPDPARLVIIQISRAPSLWKRGPWALSMH